MRNIPRDSNLKSPAQRLMSRRTRTTIPTQRSELEPQTVKKVTSSLTKVRTQKKKSYDRTATKHSQLENGQTVRIQTDKGFNRIGYIKRQDQTPRSYIVVENGKEYRRNRRHLLPVKEPKPLQVPQPEPEVEFELPPTPPPTPPVHAPPTPSTTPRSPRSSPRASPKRPVAHPSPPLQRMTTTSSGRVSKLSSKYDDFIMNRK